MWLIWRIKESNNNARLRFVHFISSRWINFGWNGSKSKRLGVSPWNYTKNKSKLFGRLFTGILVAHKEYSWQKFVYFAKTKYVLITFFSLRHSFCCPHCFQDVNSKKPYVCSQFSTNWCIGLRMIRNSSVKHLQTQSRSTNSLATCSIFTKEFSPKMTHPKYVFTVRLNKHIKYNSFEWFSQQITVSRRSNLEFDYFKTNW